MKFWKKIFNKTIVRESSMQTQLERVQEEFNLAARALASATQRYNYYVRQTNDAQLVQAVIHQLHIEKLKLEIQLDCLLN